jgi:hypothetical protein
MCRVLRFALLGTLLAVPLAAAEPAAQSPEVSSLAIGPMATAQNKSPNCPADASYDLCDARQYNSISFVNQKPNYVCVYVCYYSDTCHDTVCHLPDSTTGGSFRVRSEPYEYPWGGCPAANISFCSTMAVE